MSEEKYGPIEGFFITVFGAICGSLILTFVAIVTFPIAMLSAWIRWVLWGWFVVPYLHLPMVPYWAILGLGLLIGTFTTTPQPNGYKTTGKDAVSMLFTSVTVEFALLVIGYVVHSYLLH